MAEYGGDAGDDDAALESLDDGHVDRGVPKWVKSGTWCCAILLALPVLYFLIYPVMAMLIYQALGHPQPVPSMLDSSIVPIEWMGDRNEIYDNYTDWLQHILL